MPLKQVFAWTPHIRDLNNTLADSQTITFAKRLKIDAGGCEIFADAAGLQCNTVLISKPGVKLLAEKTNRPIRTTVIFTVGLPIAGHSIARNLRVGYGYLRHSASRNI